jgi:hypothetical protein
MHDSITHRQGTYEQRGLWGRHVDTLLDLVLEQQGQRDEDILVEVLGTLANLTVLDLPRTAKVMVALVYL